MKIGCHNSPNLLNYVLFISICGQLFCWTMCAKCVQMTDEKEKGARSIDLTP